MKTKELEWRNTISDEGQIEGWFQITSDVLIGGFCLLTSFSIRNWYDDKPKPGTFYLWIRGEDECLEFNNLDEAKQKAQEAFTEIIIDRFFEK